MSCALTELGAEQTWPMVRHRVPFLARLVDSSSPRADLPVLCVSAALFTKTQKDVGQIEL